MLLIDKLTKIVTKINSNYVCQEKWILCARTFSWSTSYAGVLIVEAFGQAAAALTAHDRSKRIRK